MLAIITCNLLLHPTMIADAELPFEKEFNFFKSIFRPANFNCCSNFVLNKASPMKNILVCVGLSWVKIKPVALPALLLYLLALFFL